MKSKAEVFLKVVDRRNKKGGVLWEKVSLFFPSWPTRPKEYATMEFSTNETRIVPLFTSGDALTAVIRQGAQQLLRQAIEAKVAEWIERHQEHRDAQGRHQVVRNGFLPQRTI